MKKYLLLLSLVLISCHYKKDKLKIVNNSETKISYEVLIKSKDDDTFYFVWAGGDIKSKDFDYPTVRSTILYALESNSSDSALYLVFFDKKGLDYVYQNEKQSF